MTPLTARGVRDLHMHLKINSIPSSTYHLEEHSSVQHLLQVLKEDNFARDTIAPKEGIEKSSFSEATDRYDLTAEQIAMIYELRWNIESFFAWWKRHLKVYHLIARSRYGLMMQMLGSLITYILLAIYCHNEFGEKVSIRRVRELRIKIKNETREMEEICQHWSKCQNLQFPNSLYAKT